MSVTPGEGAETGSLNLSSYIAVARRWRAILLLVPLATASGVWAFSSLQTPTYQATATLFVPHKSASATDLHAARLLAQTYSELVTSTPVLERVMTNAYLNESVPTLATRIKATVVWGTQVIEISVEDTDALRAAQIVNTTAEEFIGWVADEQVTISNASLPSLTKRITRIRRNINQTSTEIAALHIEQAIQKPENQRRIADLETQMRQYQDKLAALLVIQHRQQTNLYRDLVITSRAEPSRVQGSPHPLRDTALSFISGLALTITSIIVLERKTNRIRNA